MAFQHAGEAVAASRRWARPRSSCGSRRWCRRDIAPPESIRKISFLLMRAIARPRDAVMRQGRMRRHAGDRIEAHIDERAGGFAIAFQRSAASISVRWPLGASRETRRGSASARRRRGYGPCARPRFRRRSCMLSATGRDRRRAALRARLRETVEDCARAIHRIGETVCRLSASSAAENSSDRAGAPHCRNVASSGELLRASMNRSVEPSPCRSANESAKGVWGTSPPRMFKSQQIGVRQRDDGRIDLEFLHFLRDAHAFGLGGFARELERVRRCFHKRGTGLIGPDGIDRIALAGDKLGARLRRRRAQMPRWRGVQPRIVADARALRRVRGEPGARPSPTRSRGSNSFVSVCSRTWSV